MEFDANVGHHALVQKDLVGRPGPVGPTRVYPVSNDHPQLVGFRLYGGPEQLGSRLAHAIVFDGVGLGEDMCGYH